jgi:hypothetical protein
MSRRGTLLDKSFVNWSFPERLENLPRKADLFTLSEQGCASPKDGKVVFV